MLRSCVGVDIGSNELKMTVRSGNTIVKNVVVPMPMNMVKNGCIVSYDAMADFIKKTRRENNIKVRKCGVMLDSSETFLRNINMPVMSEHTLMLNLPYEFRDYIKQDKDLYFYDYAVIETKSEKKADEPETMRILAAATMKKTIADLSAMLRKAGMKLVAALPEELAYRNIVVNYERTHSGFAEYCFVDIGHNATKIIIFKGQEFSAKKIIECGGKDIDEVIADEEGVHAQIAGTYKLSNYHNVNDSDAVKRVYSHIAVELMRSINFYKFNNQGSDIKDVYFCGGCSEIQPLIDEIISNTELSVRSVSDLLPHSEDGVEHVNLCPISVGMTLC